MVVNYDNTKIYKIYSHAGDKIYVGSTTKYLLSQRMAKHRSSYKWWKSTGKVGFISSYDLFDDYGLENCIIELLEAKACMNSDEKNKLEGKYIRELKCVNKIITGRTPEEYREENKDKIKEYQKEYDQDNKEKKKQYYEDNKEKIKEYQKQYDQDNKEKIKEENKQYYQENKEKIKEKKKQYYEDNKDQINEDSKQKCNCECGSVFRRVDKSRHERTLKHKNYLETIQ
jgi:hypothetical protein